MTDFYRSNFGAYRLKVCGASGHAYVEFEDATDIVTFPLHEFTRQCGIPDAVAAFEILVGDLLAAHSATDAPKLVYAS